MLYSSIVHNEKLYEFSDVVLQENRQIAEALEAMFSSRTRHTAEISNNLHEETAQFLNNWFRESA